MRFDAKLKGAISWLQGVASRLTHSLNNVVQINDRNTVTPDSSIRRINRAFKLSLMALLTIPAPALSAAEIAIIIDDMGNHHSDKVAFELPTQVAFAILPHTPYSTKFAKVAAQEQRDVLVHMPMEALSGLSMGPGGISSDMSGLLIKQRLQEALSSVPQAIGFNNHMGSKLTQLTAPMQATMEYLNYHHLFFLDSRTTRYSKAENIAHDYGVPTMRRHVFLDHIQETQHIDYQFRRLLRKARKNGFAVGIAHPHSVTLEYLKVALKALEGQGVTLTTVSDRLPQNSNQWAWNRTGQLGR